MTRCVDRREHS